MQQGWIPQNFTTCEAGASSAFDPELIPDNQFAWLRNGRIRGGKQHTRPFLRQRLVLPQGLVQGGSYFSVQGGMFIMQIAGRIYRIRVGNRDSDFSYEEIPLAFINSPVLPTAWMVETVGSLVIQDGQSNPIIYDGSTARRSDIAENEVPLGRMMAYGNGRLWVAVGSNELVAGDIVTKQFQSELKFTETGYFLGGGKFLFPNGLTGLKFIPSSGAAGYGSLAAFTQEQTYLIKADITARDLWAQIPGFIQPLLLSTGSIGQYGIAEVNQDLYWRDADGGIRSIRSAIADETGGPGLTPMSREVSRITDYESVHRLVNTSAVSFENRLICTASPFINKYGKTSFRDLISLDFSPVSSMRGKSAPSYDGEWDGLLFDLLLTGKFTGTKRGFVVSTDYDGKNRLWEIVDNETSVADTFYACMGTSVLMESQVPMITEYPSRDWGSPAERKRLQRCDVYLSDVEDECELEVYYRPDNYQKWTKWGDTIAVCARTTDSEEASDDTPHTWKNLAGQERPQIKTLTIDDEINNLTDYAKQVGFQFQIRTVLRGKAKLHQLTVWAQPINQTQFADREIDDALCRENDITGNEINYLITPGCVMPVGTAVCDLSANLAPVFDGQWSLTAWPESVDPTEVTITSDGGSDNASVVVPEFGDYVFTLTSDDGRTMEYPYEFSCNGRFFLDLTGIPNDGTGLDGAIAVNIYIYSGTSQLSFAGDVGYQFFGSVVDITSLIVSAWTDESQSAVFLRYFQLETTDYEEALVPDIQSSSGVSTEILFDVNGQFSSGINVTSITISDVYASEFVSRVEIPPNEYGPGSMFKQAAATTYASVPAIDQYVFGDFTIEFWQYIQSTPSPQNFGRMIDNAFSTGFAIDYQSGGVVEIIGVSSGITTTSSAGVVVLDEWAHYAFRRSGTTMTIWKNGVVVKTGAVASTILTVSGSLYIGGPAETLQSYTSDLRLWNLARTDSEITDNYQERMQGNEPGLVAYYPIFETDSFFEDYTGNNVDLILRTNTTIGEPAPGRICYDPLTPPCYP